MTNGSSRINSEETMRAVPSARHSLQSGFTLMELMIAMAIFLIVSAASLSLFVKQQTALDRQQGQVGLNVALRNATSQIQMDLVNGGAGYFPGANVPYWPVGLTIVNNVVGAGQVCNTPASFTYGPNCFDQLNIIVAANPTTYPPISPTDSTGNNIFSACSDTSTGTAYGQAAPGLTLAQTAANFKSGDQILFLTNSSKWVSTAVLTADASVFNAKAVKFTFNATAANGSNTAANDPLSITTDGTDGANKLSNSFCGTDWILKLAPISYSVDSSNAADPKLMRAQSGVSSIVMEQVIGFKIGAALWNNTSNTVTTNYYYDASQYPVSTAPPVLADQPFNFTQVRSVRVSLIGRTTPNTNPTYTFRNSFDKGPYQIQGAAIIVNPRNMSMND
jgi:prepilin-type N-terminal cleavage/methylation domain-containing protein